MRRHEKKATRVLKPYDGQSQGSLKRVASDFVDLETRHCKTTQQTPSRSCVVIQLVLSFSWPVAERDRAVGAAELYNGPYKRYGENQVRGCRAVKLRRPCNPFSATILQQQCEKLQSGARTPSILPAPAFRLWLTGGSLRLHRYRALLWGSQEWPGHFSDAGSYSQSSQTTRSLGGRVLPAWPWYLQQGFRESCILWV